MYGDGTIEIGYWNVEGVKKKLIDKDFMMYLRNFDLIGLGETWVDDEFVITGFKGFFKVKNKRGNRGRMPGGIALFVKEGRGNQGTVVENKLQECLWVRVKYEELDLIVGVVYNQPRGSPYENKNFFREFKGEIQEIRERVKGIPIIVMGDFNARVGDKDEGKEIEGDELEWQDVLEEGRWDILARKRQSKDKEVNRAGKDLLMVCREVDMIILNGRSPGDRGGEMTCIGSTGASVVDYILVDSATVESIQEMRVDTRVESNHMPVVLRLKTGKDNCRKVREGTASGRRIKKWKWDYRSKEKWGGKVEYMYRIGVEEAIKGGLVEQAHSLFCRLLERVCTRQEKESSERKGQVDGWYDEECKAEKLKLNRKLRIFRTSRRTEDLQVYKEGKMRYNQLCKEKREGWGKRVRDELSSFVDRKEERLFWRRVVGKRQIQNEEANISEEEWLEHFKGVFGEVAERDKESGDDSEIEEEGNTNTLEDEEITSEEIIRAIKVMKKGKAAGIDGFPIEVFQGLLEVEGFVEMLKGIFNLIFRTGEVPKVWGMGVVVTIYKGKGDRTDPNNFRGVSLLAVGGKIFGRILAERISKWAENEGKIAEEQAGFRRGFSTLDNVMLISMLAERELGKEKGYMHAGFVDFEKAFDSIDRERLWDRLSSMGVGKKLIKVLKSWYGEARICVRKGKSVYVTEDFKTGRGVRQGCQLSPILFALYINEIIKHLEEVETHSPCLGSREVKCLLYADDLVLLSLSKVGLQRAFDALATFCEVWGLKVNTKKTNILTFSKGKLRERGWYYKGEKVKEVDKFRYLGVILQRNLNWKSQQEEAIIKAQRGWGIVRKMLYKFDCPVSWIWKVFDGMIGGILFYGGEIWGAKVIKSKLDRLGARIGKEILGVGKTIINEGALKELGRKPLSKTVEQRMVTYALRLRHEPGNRRLLKLCFDTCLKTQKSPWIKQVAKRCTELGLGEMWEQGYRTERSMKKEVRESVGKEGERETDDIIRGRKTLSNYLRMGSPEFYLQVLNRQERAAFAWFRLGGWKWQGKKREDGKRECPLCEELDGEGHILVDCRELKDVRKGSKVMGGEIRNWNWEHWVKTKNKDVVKKLAEMLIKVRGIRGKKVQAEIGRGRGEELN